MEMINPIMTGAVKIIFKSIKKLEIIKVTESGITKNTKLLKTSPIDLKNNCN